LELRQAKIREEYYWGQTASDLIKEISLEEIGLWANIIA
jgi:hypothetical protein